MQEKIKAATGDPVFDEKPGRDTAFCRKTEAEFADCTADELAALLEILRGSRIAHKKHGFFTKN